MRFFCFVFFIFYTLFMCNNVVALQKTQKNACRIGINAELEFRYCRCKTTVEEKSVLIYCQGQLWTSIPNLSHIFSKNEFINRPIISTFLFNDGHLSMIGQDAFNGENVKIIDFSGNAIDSVNVNAFRGLESSLFQLNFDRNSLTSVPSWAFTYLHRLEHLSLRANQIGKLTSTTFRETQLKNLRYLHLDKNRIDVLPKETLNTLQLQVLTLSENRIRHLEKQSLPISLLFLDLKNNILTKIPYMAIKDLHKLTMIDLEGNNISLIMAHSDVKFENTEIDMLLSNNKIQKLEADSFNSFVRFGRLDLSYNQIFDINANAFRTIHSVKNLDLSYNLISTIPQNTFGRFRHTLESLNLEENALKNIPLALQTLSALQQLNMNNNRLTNLDEELFQNFKANLTMLTLAFNRLTEIPTEIIQGMLKLRNLDLSKNNIQKIGKMAFGGFKNTPGTNLVKLNLAGNEIQEVSDPGAFLYMSSLVYLDLSFNRITRLTSVALERLENLETLFLQNNDMIEFPRSALSNLNKLRHLILDHNKILNLPNYAFQWLVHLERLSVSHNRIHTLNAKTFHSKSANQVKWLNLGFNKITTMHTAAFENLPNIEQLLLNNNCLTTLQPQVISSLRNLRFLNLAHNQIYEIKESAFENLPLLESLSLANNRLCKIKKGIFQRVPNLARLDLNHNCIESFDLNVLENSVHQLQFLDLSYNQIKKLDVSSAKHSLIKLETQHNQFEFVDNIMLHGFEKLISVDLSHNHLIEVHSGAFLMSPSLQRIILANNNLQTVWRETFIGQKLIQLLDLGNNVLNSLEAGVFGRNNVIELNLLKNNFTAFPTRALASIRRSLTTLDLSYNAISVLEWRDFEGLTNITILRLAHNKIEALEEEVFREMPFLKFLDLSSNPIVSWSPHAFWGLSNSIQHINLAKTGLFSLPKLYARNLKTLNISHNKIYELYPNDVEALGKLTGLDLAYNNLLDLKSSVFEKLQELKHLNLSGNGVRILQPEHFKNLDQLEILHLGKMEALVRLPEPKAFAALRHLKQFYIYDLPQVVNYDIQKILQFLPPLKALNFEYMSNRLPDSLFKKVDLRLLRKLTIRGAKIQEIDSSTFERLRGFRIELVIQDTALRNFSSEIVQRMSGVSFLNLALVNNRIETFNPFLNNLTTKPPMLNRQGTILESINLKDNLITCDCRLDWLSDWIDYHSADNNAQWLKAKQMLATTKCIIPNWVRNKKNESRSLLEIYDKSFYSNSLLSTTIKETTFWNTGNSNLSMRCDAEGRLLSAQPSFRNFIGSKFIVFIAIIIILCV